ncbi:uncharacterized protein LOC135389281 [Ornithodoros turicata]|uniref:uncharacterized protein LOC135389281 n=1 Tax=Ornithodoros turicata TaxID=34597 RepID=UPI00313881AD
MGLRGSLAPIVVDILHQVRRLHDGGHHISLQWIPGHCGLRGNEEADRVATAANESPRAVPIVLSRSDRRALLTAWFQPLALEQWRRDITAQSLMNSVDPNLAFPFPTSLLRHVTSLLHTLRLNVAFTPQFKCMIRCCDTGLCSTCGVVATAQHVLMECSLYCPQRRTLCGELARISERPLTLAALIGPYEDPVLHPRVLHLFMDFLSTTGLLQTL